MMCVWHLIKVSNNEKRIVQHEANNLINDGCFVCFRSGLNAVFVPTHECWKAHALANRTALLAHATAP